MAALWRCWSSGVTLWADIADHGAWCLVAECLVAECLVAPYPAVAPQLSIAFGDEPHRHTIVMGHSGIPTAPACSTRIPPVVPIVGRQ